MKKKIFCLVFLLIVTTSCTSLFKNETSKDAQSELKLAHSDPKNKEVQDKKEVIEEKLMDELTIHEQIGQFDGIVDGHSVEITLEDKTNVFIYDESLKNAISTLKIGDTVQFYYEENEIGQNVLIDIKSE